MAAFKPLILDKNETDIHEIMTKLYRFSEDLKFTLSNLSNEDNFDNSFINILNERNKKMREINFNSDELSIDLRDYESGVHTRLEQTNEKISFLVQRGGVVETMLTRMELYKESITLKTGQVIILSENMTLDKAGNVYFSGNITGGSINIAKKFIVNTAGECYIDGILTTETLNPPAGIYADELDVYNENDMVNTVTGNITCWDAYISETLNCRKVYVTSDERGKKNIGLINRKAAAEALKAIIPMRYTFVDTGREAIGCIAQDIYRFCEKMEESLPLVGRHGKYLELPYSSYGTIYNLIIKQNQERINKLEKKIEKIKGEYYVEL